MMETFLKDTLFVENRGILAGIYRLYSMGQSLLPILSFYYAACRVGNWHSLVKIIILIGKTAK